MEGLAKYYEQWVKEFHEFIRDHCSQDPVSLSVERIYEDQCSFCGYKWENAVDENGCPGCCNQAVREWENEHKKEDTT